MRRKLLLMGLGLAALASLVIASIQHKYIGELTYAREQYVHDESAMTQNVALQVESSLTQAYQGARTIARLPGVMSIDRYARGFEGNSRQTVQEIYNNLASNVDLSEVYIVDKDLDPDKIDPHTKEHYEPITTFDELIIGKNLTSDHEESEENEVEEVEIYEYRLMKEQIAFFQKNWPTLDSIKGLDYPAIMGREVITCDNRFVHPENVENADRSGLVYSVPFYGPDSKLRGTISVVLLTKVLAQYLPSAHFALVDPESDYSSFRPGGEAARLADDRKAARIPAQSIYAESLKLRVNDQGHKWYLWVAKPTSEFYGRGDVQGAGLFRTTAVGATLLVCSMLFVFGFGHLKREEDLTVTNQSLEEEVKQRTTDLVAARKLEAIGQMASGVAHEINTPAQFISDNLRFLESGTRKVADWHDALTEAAQDHPKLQVLVADRAIQRFIHEAPLSITESLEGTSRINEIVRAMRDYAHPDTAPTTDANLNAIIQNTVVIARNTVKQSATVHMELRESLPSAYCNPGEIGQVILNLVVNASHAIADTKRPDGRIEIKSWHDADWVAFSVSDNGTGIPEELVGRIFDQFFTTKELGVGTGMGLSIVRHVVEKHGGTISLKSKMGEGTTFTVRLPKVTSKLMEGAA